MSVPDMESARRTIPELCTTSVDQKAGSTIGYVSTGHCIRNSRVACLSYVSTGRRIANTWVEGGPTASVPDIA
eukprot:2771821-Rhodomonas_salina.1